MMLIKCKLFSIIHEASHLPCVGKERVTLIYSSIKHPVAVLKGPSVCLAIERHLHRKGKCCIL